MNYSFHPAAEAEFLESVGYYESKVPGLGGAFIEEFEVSANLVGESITRFRGAEKDFTMTKYGLAATYREYIACLNIQDWPTLKHYVHDDVSHNGTRLGIEGYREMLERDFTEIPDLHFNIELLAVDPPYVASRLRFNCTPKGTFLNLDINGMAVSFTENVFYRFLDGRVIEVWSVIDKHAIEAQLRSPSGGI